MKLRAITSKAIVACAVFVACAGLAACSDGSSNIFRSSPTYYPTAEQNYDYGLKEMKSGNWINAEQYFQHIKNKFAFTRWATLAELGIADTEMGREKWIEAIDDYKAFIRAHPHHERVEDGYAAFRIGEGHFKQIPSDWFVMPPSYEKDQSPVIDALRELGAYLDTYPESPYHAKAEKMHDDCVRRLADHELYVANFYLKLHKPHAAIGRLEGVVNKYPGARREPETLLLLGRTYMALDKPLEARRTFVKLAAEHATDYRAEKARLYVAFIDKRFPNLVDGPDPGDPKKRDPKAGLLPPDSGATDPAAHSGTPTSPATTSPAPQNNTAPPSGAQ